MATRTPRNENKYYAITIIANQEGKSCWNCYSYCAGFENDEGKVELRQASLVRASRVVKTLRNDLKEGCFVADTVEELRVFLLLADMPLLKKKLLK